MVNERTRQWVYHRQEQAKIVLKTEAKKLYQEGWYASPAFPEPEEVKKAEPEKAKPKKKKPA